MVGEMSVRGNVLVGKCPVGEVSGRGIVGKCPSGIFHRGSVSRGSVRLENCPTIVFHNSGELHVMNISHLTP